MKANTHPAGRRARLLIPFFGLLVLAADSRAAEYYVAPNASGSGTGTLANPWQLQTALSSPLNPGDTVWLRGGTYSGIYTGYLTGSAASPIIVRQYPGERAIIDGGNSNGQPIFVAKGSYTWYWGFEVMSSNPIRSTSVPGSSPPGSSMPRGEGVMIDQGSPHPGLKFINMVVHDARQGFSFWEQAQSSEIYGCLVYYNGWSAPDSSHGHGIYAQNQTGNRKVTDNILFSGFRYGFHAYAQSAHLDYLDMEGNTSFNAGNLAGGARNLLLGGEAGVVPLNPIIKNNYLYRTVGGDGYFNLGYSGGCSNATVTNNYIANGAELSCLPTTMTGNTFYGTIDGWTQGQYPSNTYYSSRPTGVQVFVRPNAYEAGRANVTVFNWDLAGSASVNLSGILSVGQGFEIRNAHDFFGAPVVTGTYAGGNVSIPMTGLSVATPVGWAAPPNPGPEFGAFVVLPTALGSGEFIDVPPGHPYHAAIHTLVLNGITAGCSPSYYCPDANVSRAEMAVFLLKSKHGSGFVPPNATGTVFDDVPVGSFADDWIEELAVEGITGGCTPQDYCPNAPASRAEMAVFLLKALLGSSYAPPPATGTVFTDVPANGFAAAWIEDLAGRGITGGCGGGKYCPNNSVSRGEMAVFLVSTFSLQ